MTDYYDMRHVRARVAASGFENPNVPKNFPVHVSAARTKAPKCQPVLRSNHFPSIFWYVRPLFDG